MEWFLWVAVIAWLLYLTYRQAGLRSGLEVLARLIDRMKKP